MKTYISLFSSAGIGCYGFTLEGFECIATNEFIERRLDIQKVNNKCKYESGYIYGDITKPYIQSRLFKEIDLWKSKENLDKVDVLIATPPCQGMSTANYKKGNEINRNSLVVEAISLIEQIKPRVFVFENVKAFLKTMCIDKNESICTIEECINKHLSNEYNIYSKVINFMDYGIPSSRPRTIVIGTSKEEKNFSPLNLFPLKQNKITLFEAIGNMPSLQYGQTDSSDILHSFRIYPKYMQKWIHNLKEGETAFNNNIDNLPFKLINGKKQILKSGHMGNKFRRMFWNQPAPCVTTRNDQLASQSTIHPKDDRVLSIRELMKVMTIPNSFKWIQNDLYTKKNIDKKETLIRQVIGEAVPTEIIRQIAKNLREMLEYDSFIKRNNYSNYSKELLNNFYIKSFVFEQELSNTKETGTFYTPQIVVYNTIKNYKPNKKEIKILEPSVGLGAFIPQMLRLIDDCDIVEITCIDTSKESIDLLKSMIKDLNLSKKFIFKYINNDFLCTKLNNKYDVIFTNPPFFKLNANLRKKYKDIFDTVNDNIFCLFLKKIQLLSDEILIVLPKTFIMIPDCNDIRCIFETQYSIVSIYDYGVSFFKKVFIEILSIHFSRYYNGNIFISNCRDKEDRFVKQGYIYHSKMWFLYRDDWFDKYISKLQLDVFDFYRDRQLTNKYLSSNKNKIWVLRSKNLLDNGTIVSKNNYDKYISNLDNFILKKYFNTKSIIFTNFTYNTRATILPNNCTVNGSFCILLPKSNKIKINLQLYSTSDFRRYYSIVKNKSKFTINIDSNTIYYIGVKKNDK